MTIMREASNTVTRFTRLESVLGKTTSLSDSPCTGVCTVTQWGDARCKGCGRFEAEIKNWAKFSNLEKKLINLRNSKDYNIRQKRLR